VKKVEMKDIEMVVLTAFVWVGKKVASRDQQLVAKKVAVMAELRVNERAESKVAS
jgi:hypothetical protein